MKNKKAITEILSNHYQFDKGLLNGFTGEMFFSRKLSKDDLKIVKCEVTGDMMPNDHAILNKVILENIKKCNIDPKHFESYINMRWPNIMRRLVNKMLIDKGNEDAVSGIRLTGNLKDQCVTENHESISGISKKDMDDKARFIKCLFQKFIHLLNQNNPKNVVIDDSAKVIINIVSQTYLDRMYNDPRQEMKYRKATKH